MKAGQKESKVTAHPFDGEALRHALTSIWQEGLSESKLRQSALNTLSDAVKSGRAHIEAEFEGDCDGTRCAATLSDLQDELIRVIYDFTVTHVYRAKNPSDAERISIVAQGGYGRGSLAPGSDIDLLFLLPYKQTPCGFARVVASRSR